MLVNDKINHNLKAPKEIFCPLCKKSLPVRKSKDGRYFTDINHIQECVSLLEEERSNQRCESCHEYGCNYPDCGMPLEPEE
jgi:hypothetical protein